MGAPAGYAASKMDLGPLAAEIKELEAKRDSGEGSFSTALSLASKKMQYSIGEGLQGRPILGTLMGAGLGAMTGASAGPTLWEEGRKMPETAGKLRKAFQGAVKK